MTNGKRIAAIGEVLWDMMPTGKQPGGAPANFCFHANKLGANTALISAVGKDKNGSEISQFLHDKGITLFLNTVEKQTGYVSINLEKGIPAYTIHEDIAWDFIAPSADALDWVSKADAICFGSLAQRSPVSKKSIELALDTAQPHALKVFDINLRQHYFTEGVLMKSLQMANVVKLNDEELDIISKILGLHGDTENMCRQLMETFQLQLVALTMGAQGSLLIRPDMVSFLNVPQIEAIDTIGAGDSFNAALVVGLLHNKDLRLIHREATAYAAKVCTYSGGMPDFELEFLLP